MTLLYITLEIIVLVESREHGVREHWPMRSTMNVPNENLYFCYSRLHFISPFNFHSTQTIIQNYLTEDTLFRTATPSTWLVCGKKSKPRMLSIS